MNILEELYYGNIKPHEKTVRRESGYDKFVKIVSANEEKLTTFLKSIPKSEEEQHLFSQMINAQTEIAELDELERFIEGFKLGARLIIDTFLIERSSLIQDICGQIQYRD